MQARETCDYSTEYRGYTGGEREEAAVKEVKHERGTRRRTGH